jgi:predicted dehydrogenase
LFLQKATHDFDYMMYLMGAPITRITAMALKGRVFGGMKKAGLVCSKCDEQRTCLESPGNRKANGAGGIGQDHPCVFGRDIGTPAGGMNEDASSALFEFANGAQGVYTQVFFSRRDAATRGATISGYDGTLSFDWYTGSIKYVRHHKSFSDTIKALGGGAHFGGDVELIRNFANVIKYGEKSETPIEVGLQSVYTCLAAKEASEKGTYVKVRQI